MELRKQDIARRCQLWYRKPLRSQSRNNTSRNTDVRNGRIKTTCFYETMQPHWWQITFFYLQKLIHLHYTYVHNVSHLSSTDFSWSGAIPFGIISTFNFEMTNLMIYSVFGRLCAYLPNFFALNIVSSLCVHSTEMNCVYMSNAFIPAVGGELWVYHSTNRSDDTYIVANFGNSYCNKILSGHTSISLCVWQDVARTSTIFHSQSHARRSHETVQNSFRAKKKNLLR